MTFVSINEWRLSSVFARSIQLAERKIEKLLRESETQVARINGIICAEQVSIDTVVAKYVTTLAQNQTADGKKFALRTKERVNAEKYIMLVGACVLASGGVANNPTRDFIVNNQWCTDTALDKRVYDLRNKEVSITTQLDSQINANNQPQQAQP